MQAFLRHASAACLLAAAIGLASPAPAAGQAATGADIKAAFLYNFAKFVEWPVATAGVDPGAFVIGVLGHDAIADSLTEFVKGKAHQGRRLVVRRLSARDDLTKVHILFIGASESASVPELLRRLGPAGVLTVSDADRFCALGGVIQFRTQADRVRFDVNVKTAESAGLVINSKLLALAGTVHRSRQ
jgi:hypothetical protein